MNRLQPSHQPSVARVLDRVHSTLRGIQRQQAANTLRPDIAKRQLQEALCNLSRLEGTSALPDADLNNAVKSVKEVLENLPTTNESAEQPQIQRYDQTVPHTNGRGRRNLDIDMNRVKQLLQLGFSVKQIAEDGLLGGLLHVNTLYKKLKENNMQIRLSYSNASDDELQQHISDYNRDHPNAGVMEVQAYLKTKGLIVQRQRCREILGRVDTIGIE